MEDKRRMCSEVMVCALATGHDTHCHTLATFDEVNGLLDKITGLTHQRDSLEDDVARLGRLLQKAYRANERLNQKRKMWKERANLVTVIVWDCVIALRKLGYKVVVRGQELWWSE